MTDNIQGQSVLYFVYLTICPHRMGLVELPSRGHKATSRAARAKGAPLAQGMHRCNDGESTKAKGMDGWRNADP